MTLAEIAAANGSALVLRLEAFCREQGIELRYITHELLHRPEKNGVPQGILYLKLDHLVTTLNLSKTTFQPNLTANTGHLNVPLHTVTSGKYRAEEQSCEELARTAVNGFFETLTSYLAPLAPYRVTLCCLNKPYVFVDRREGEEEIAGKITSYDRPFNQAMAWADFAAYGEPK